MLLLHLTLLGALVVVWGLGKPSNSSLLLPLVGRLLCLLQDPLTTDFLEKSAGPCISVLLAGYSLTLFLDTSPASCVVSISAHF